MPLVRVEGLEPPRLAAPEPKSGASTNFATPATLPGAAKPRRVRGRIAKLWTGCEKIFQADEPGLDGVSPAPNQKCHYANTFLTIFL